MNFEGQPVRVEFRPRLRVSKGKLVTQGQRGTAVHAAAFLRERRIVLDRSLLRKRSERDRILAHELFHFVWWKGGVKRRASYEALIRAELKRTACHGEMGWSAELRKQGLTLVDRERRTRRWREYLCESFCDTAAAFALEFHSHPEITLAATARRQRYRWFHANLDLERLKI